MVHVLIKIKREWISHKRIVNKSELLLTFFDVENKPEGDLILTNADYYVFI